jgi:hypothetical protein
MTNRVQKLSTPEYVDLSLLTVKELERLHFDEEVWAAEKIRATAPFSSERNDLLKKGYELVTKIMHEKALKSGKTKSAFGANNQYCRLVKKLINRIRLKNNNNKVVYYEAGIGTGLVASSLLEDKDVIIRGCDVYLDPKLKSNPRFNFHEGTLFDAPNEIDFSEDTNLSVNLGGGRQDKKNTSIDLFYWNDVLEHLLEDEADQYVDLIHRKMTDNGIICTITPNKFIGPSDITKLFYPYGTKPKGFHFREYSYFEVKTIFESHGFREECCILMNPFNKEFYITVTSILGIKVIEFIRKIAESFAPMLYPLKVRKAVLLGLGCHITIFRKYR